MKQKFYLFGFLAPIFYLMAVIMGGFLINDYSHLNQMVSEIDPLLEGGSKILVNSLFWLYNICSLLYGSGIYLNYKKRGASYIIQALCIIVISLSGMLMYFFPMDIMKTEITTVGVIHIALATLIAPLTVMGCFVGYWAFESNNKMRIYALMTSIVILVFGMTSAIFTANLMTGMGLLERITIGSYILWLSVTAFYYKNNKS